MSCAQEYSKKCRSSLEVCVGAAREMRAILDGLEEYSGVYEETTALRQRLDRIEKACGRVSSGVTLASTDGNVRDRARDLIAQMPLQEIFQDPDLSNAFLSELLLALARESSSKDRRERQRQGIEEAKAQGVRFGRAKRPLPDNFDAVRRAWREGQFSLTEAASRCDMPKTTFYGAAQRAERAAAESQGSPPVPERRRPRQAEVNAQLS